MVILFSIQKDTWPASQGRWGKYFIEFAKGMLYL